MKIILVASPVSAFEIMLIDNGETIDTATAFYCDVISRLQNLMQQYNVDNIHVVGQRNYVLQIVEELKEIFSVSITY